MADVFHRDRGRAWDLRQQSLRLWQEWLGELAERGHRIPHREGLLLLADDPAQRERLEGLVERRRALGLPLELWERERLELLTPEIPQPALAGLFSERDGQLDPGAALTALADDAASRGLTTRSDAAVAIEPHQGGWQVRLAAGGSEAAGWVVLAAGVAGSALLEAAVGKEARTWELEPVLGQALELELDQPLALNWPGAVVWRGINLVPRPDLAEGRGLWLGATLEPGRRADPHQLAGMRHLDGAAPDWLRRARVLRHWQGLRPRPVGRPAPLLEAPAAGLLLVGGHYRNGILLAPATAAWVAERIEAPV